MSCSTYVCPKFPTSKCSGKLVALLGGNGARAQTSRSSTHTVSHAYVNFLPRVIGWHDIKLQCRPGGPRFAGTAARRLTYTGRSVGFSTMRLARSAAALWADIGYFLGGTQGTSPRTQLRGQYAYIGSSDSISMPVATRPMPTAIAGPTTGMKTAATWARVSPIVFQNCVTS